MYMIRIFINGVSSSNKTLRGCLESQLKSNEVNTEIRIRGKTNLIIIFIGQKGICDRDYLFYKQE